MKRLTVHTDRISDAATSLNAVKAELSFVQADAGGCGSWRVANGIADAETWCGVATASIALSLDASIRAAENSVAMFTDLDNTLGKSAAEDAP